MGLYDSPTPRGKGGGTYDSSGWGGKKKAHHHGGLLGGLISTGHFFEHLGGDVKDAAVGLPMGVAQTVRHPVRTSKLAGKTTWHDWSPLFHGHAGTWAHNFTQHPLAPLLDIATVAGAAATVATGGLAAPLEAEALSARGATELSQLGKVKRLATQAKHQREVRVVDPKGVGPDMYRPLSRKQHVRLLQHLTLKTRGKGATHPWLGADRHYAKLSQLEAMHSRAGVLSRMRSLEKAFRKMDNETNRRGVLKHVHGQIDAASHVMPVTAREMKAPAGFHFVTDSRHADYGSAGQDLSTALGETTARYLTKDITKASKVSGENGREYVKVIRSNVAKAYGDEGRRSANALRKIFTAPTQVWRTAILGLRPAFFVNNAVGNYFMYMMAHGDMHGARGYMDALRQVWGEKGAAKRLKSSVFKGDQHFMEKHFANEMSGTFVQQWDNKVGRHVATRIGQRALKGVGPITDVVAEKFLRRAAINAELRKSTEVRALMRSGHSFDQAAAKALDKHPQLQGRITKYTNDVLGDYHGMTKTDRAIRDFVPFYGWDKAITRHTANLLRDRPAAALVGATMGTQGTHQTEQTLGQIPSFLKGVIPLGKKHGDRRDVLTTQGLNPYATIPDLVDAMSSLGGKRSGDDEFALESQLGPIPAGVIDQLRGTKASGQPVQFQNLPLPASILANMGVNLPEVKLMQSAMHAPATSHINKRTGLRSSTLYTHTFDENMAAFLGAPVKHLSAKQAKALKKRKRKKNIYGH